jgi:predicted AlkP superfamily pyrophosphatase or phosphodiesterase
LLNLRRSVYVQLKRMISRSRFLLVLTGLFLGTGLHAAPRAEHVFIFSFDGGKPAAIAESEMPVLKRLAAEGAHTWVANTIFPSKTLPSHTSMLSGFGPEKHMISWNNWIPAAGLVRVPTIFALARSNGLSTAMFVGKEKFRHLNLPGTVDKFVFDKSRSGEAAKDSGEEGAKQVKEGTVKAEFVAADAAKWIVDQKPRLCFIHFPDPDSAGHKYGWHSAEQKKAFAECDAALGVVLKAIEQAGLRDRSVILISADHGGHAKTHGLNTPEDMNIPWIAWGRGVKKGYTITAPVTTCDTAATALWLLGVAPAADTDGRPVTSAFE